VALGVSRAWARRRGEVPGGLTPPCVREPCPRPGGYGSGLQAAWLEARSEVPAALLDPFSTEVV